MLDRVEDDPFTGYNIYHEFTPQFITYIEIWKGNHRSSLGGQDGELNCCIPVVKVGGADVNVPRATSDGK